MNSTIKHNLLGFLKSEKGATPVVLSTLPATSIATMCALVAKESPSDQLVLYSANEFASNNEKGFWSKDIGWTDYSKATVFTRSELDSASLPASVGGDTSLVSKALTDLHFGEKGRESVD